MVWADGRGLLEKMNLIPLWLKFCSKISLYFCKLENEKTSYDE